MIIKPFKIKDFQTPDNEVSIAVPTGSIFRTMKIFHDGVYAIYEVPELVMNTYITDKYVLIGRDKSIPNGAEYIDILDLIVELPIKEGDTVPEQAIQLISIYKIL